MSNIVSVFRGRTVMSAKCGEVRFVCDPIRVDLDQQCQNCQSSQCENCRPNWHRYQQNQSFPAQDNQNWAVNQQSNPTSPYNWNTQLPVNPNQGMPLQSQSQITKINKPWQKANFNHKPCGCGGSH